MSIRLISDILDHSREDHGALLVLIVLANYADENGFSYPSIATIAKKSRLCERNVQSVLRHLVKTKQLTINIGMGRCGSNLYQILPAAYAVHENAPPHSHVDGGAKSCTGGVHSDVKIVHENAPNPSVIRQGTEPSVDPSLPGMENSRTKSSEEWAEEIYSHYPKKVGKPVAIKAIIKVIRSKGITVGYLLERTKLFAAIRGTEDPDFIPHPSTWFNQQRFHDDPSTWRRRPQKPVVEQCDAKNEDAWKT